MYESNARLRLLWKSQITSLNLALVACRFKKRESANVNSKEDSVTKYNYSITNDESIVGTKIANVHKSKIA